MNERREELNERMPHLMEATHNHKIILMTDDQRCL